MKLCVWDTLGSVEVFHYELLRKLWLLPIAQGSGLHIAPRIPTLFSMAEDEHSILTDREHFQGIDSHYGLSPRRPSHKDRS